MAEAVAGCHHQRQSRQRYALVALLMTLSGFAGLVYQIVWLQQLGTWLGHEVSAVLAVVAAFFGGIALGAWILGPRIARSLRPGRWYAALEFLIALWGLLLLAFMPVFGDWLTLLIGAEPGVVRHWSLAFLLPFILLLPATAAMGATLPAMERVLGRLREAGYSIAALYATNTTGAVAGVLASAFWLAPGIGLAATAAVAIVSNLVCAGLAWFGLGGVQRAPVASPAGAATGHATLVRLGITGLLGIGTEVLVVRVLSQVAENTVYTYALLLAVYLLGTACGAAAYQKWLAVRRDGERVRALLLVVVASSTLACVPILAAAPLVKSLLSNVLGATFVAVLGAEALLGLVAFALPTLAMGALFSHLAVEGREAGWSLGHGLAANTFGATLAAPLFGVVLLPVAGAGLSLCAIGFCYLLLVPARASRSRWVWVTATSAIALALVGPGLRMVVVTEGSHIVSHVDGVLAAVSVIEDADGVRRLHINNREQEGSSATRVADARQAWLPLMLHPAPERALFLGLGTGVTASSAVQPGLHIEAVELLPEVVDAAAHFVPALADPKARPINVIVADARRAVRAGRARYDVIVADLFHPARSGSASLFTREHFAAVRARLAAGGLFCQWLPLHQLDLDSLRAIVAAFVDVYPDAVAVLATHSLDTPVIGLIGRDEALRWSAGMLESRRAQTMDASWPAELQLDDPWAVPGSIVADARALRRFSENARPNRDDWPVVAYRAPRLRNAGGMRPRERLRDVLAAFDADPASVFGAPGKDDDAVWQRRLSAYWRARDYYLEAGMNVRLSADAREMLTQVREPLFETLRLSPDFRPAYDPLLRMSLAIAQQDPEQARALLIALQNAQPGRPEALQALRRIESPL